MEALTRLHSNGRLLALLENIRIGWKGMAVTNIVPYYDIATIVVVKKFNNTNMELAL